MKIIMGRLLFWLLWPLVWVYAPTKLRVRILVVCGDEFLATKSYFGRGYWELPGGGVKKGENPDSAAVRELYEETGIKCTKDAVTPLIPPQIFYESGLKMRYQIFVIKLALKPQTTMQKHEIAALEWLLLKANDSKVANHVTAALSHND